jgi:oligopeptide/dipeptide ABC transporter ATP-binding protein
VTPRGETPAAGDVTLALEQVTTSLMVGSRLRPVIIDVDITLRAGEIVGLVGESGSGKSMTARTIANALPPSSTATGSVLLNGENLLTMRRRRRRAVQPQIGMIFQDPRAFIDPLWRVEDHMTEGMRVHLGLSRSEARTRAIELLDTVGIDQPEKRMRQYPGQLSGGMLQRVMIAGALSVEPTVLLADEATTALDVTTQAAIVRLLDRLRAERGLSVLFITHDLALANSICDRVCVMYAGRLVEVREGRRIFDDPRHPYTMGLLAARPGIETRSARLPVIAGTPISAMEAPDGCAFHPRCPYVLEACRQGVPDLVSVPGGIARCLRATEDLPDLSIVAAPAAATIADSAAAPSADDTREDGGSWS